MDLRISLSPEILNAVARLDHFQGRWSAGGPIPARSRQPLVESALVRSVGASCRLAGIRLSDAEAEALLRGEPGPPTDAGLVAGYAAALRHGLPPAGELLSTPTLRRLHATMMGQKGASPWRAGPLHRESFDAQGHATGLVFPTLPARMIEDKTEELLTWVELELRSGEQHRALVVAAFTLCLMSVSPFDRGSVRLSRLLLGLMLRRAGYEFVSYASLEAEMEPLREQYYETALASQTHLWNGDADLRPWLGFVLTVIGRHCDRVEAALRFERERERDQPDLPPLQRAIVRQVSEHGDVDAALLIRATGANRNTLKDNLRRLVERGVLERTGQRRGTRYRLAAPRLAGVDVARQTEV